MQLALTNVGHRRALAVDRKEPGRAPLPGLDEALVALLGRGHEPWQGSRAQRDLMARAWVEAVEEPVDEAAIALRYRRNPLENVIKVVVEFTTCCNLSCEHCYNAGVGLRTENDLAALDAATAVFADMAIPNYSFTGGEVSKFGSGWLGLARSIRARGAQTISVLSNGWFLGEKDFEAAGRRYRDDRAYLDDLRDHGVSHVVFSIDGPEAVHDRSRGSPGLYARVVGGLGRVREASLEPRLSLLARSGPKDELARLVLDLAPLLYGQSDGAMERFCADETNIVSNFIDIGNGARKGGGIGYSLDAFPAEILRCKAFYRPYPHLTLKANGELSTCRIAQGGEGYGNFHLRPMVDILNHMQDAFIYRLHAEGRIADYLPLVDPEVFGTTCIHPCSLRAFTTMVAQRMHEAGVEAGDGEAVARINREVAAITGHLKDGGHRV